MKQGQLKVFRSSAGSGKTFTLAREYLKILFRHREVYQNTGTEDYFRHILAITFTNDAANEMKERVLRYLREFSQWDGADMPAMMEAIIRDFREEYPNWSISAEDIKKRSETILRSILHRYSEFNIQTIDSFTNQVARSFSRELGLPGNYEIYLDTQLKLDEAVDELLAGISDKQQLLMDWLFRFVEGQIDQDKSWNIAWQLRQFARNLVDERKSDLLAKIRDFELEDFAEISRQLHADKAKMEKEVEKMARAGLDVILHFGLEHEDLHFKKQGIRAFFEAHAVKPFDKLSNRGSKDGLGKDKWLRDEGIAKLGARVAEFEDQVRNITVDLAAYLENHHKEHGIYTAVLGNLYQLALLSRINQILIELKDRDEQAFLSDLNAKIRDVVLSEPIPFIYERAGVKFKHLLIDEFQDTSLFQWINLVPLIANAMAEGNVNLIVGDAKQSIYGWRGAKPELLVDLPELKKEYVTPEIESHLHVLRGNTLPEVLKSNWRSARQIVEFNNALFRYIRDTQSENFPELTNFYRDIEQEARGKGEADIRIDVIQTEKELNKQELQELKSELITEYIDSCGHEWRDIAILCRSHEDIYRITRVLVDRDISIVSEESLLLKNSPVVRMLVRVFELCYEPENHEQRFRLFTDLLNLKGKTVEDWDMVLRGIRAKHMSDFLQFILDFFGLEFGLKRLSEGTIFKIGTEWIRAFELQKISHEQVYIDFFLDILFERSRMEGAGIGSFLEYWKDKGDSLAISSSVEQNAVRLMTVHKAKGLEFPVVIIPYPEWSHSKSGGQLWVEWNDNNPTKMPVAVVNSQKNLIGTSLEAYYNEEKQNRFMEELNALYVSTTRPESRMYIISSDLKGGYISELINDFLEENAFEYAEMSYRGHAMKSYHIAKQSEAGGEKIETVIKPWNSANHDRVGIEKRLRWSVEYALDDEKLAFIEKGKTWHRLLEHLKYRNDKDRVVKLGREYLPDQEACREFEALIEQICSSIELSFMFRGEYQIRTEMEMIGEGELLRPDRVQVSDNEVIVVDYKTGLEHDQHKKQVQKYTATLKRIYPEKKVSAYLLYTDKMKLVGI